MKLFEKTENTQYIHIAIYQKKCQSVIFLFNNQILTVEVCTVTLTTPITMIKYVLNYYETNSESKKRISETI